MREKGSAFLREDAPMRLLVLGQAGQVAVALSRLRHSDVLVTCAGRPDLDLEAEASVARAIARHAPHVVVNAGAFTAVDRAESEPDKAFAINAKGAGNAAAACAEAGIPIIHISTDYVYSGRKTTPYMESDPTGPVNVYGRSKLAGEAAVAANNPDCLILRTAWIYAPWGANFARTMLRLAQERDVVRVVADQFGAPTYAPHLAEAILHVARKIRPGFNTGWRGVYHMTSGGAASWADFAEHLFSASSRRNGPYARVERITTAEYPTPAARPALSVLSNAKLRDTFGVELPNWQAGADAFVEAYPEVPA